MKTSEPVGREGLTEDQASDPVERLLEDSWDSRSRRANRRELLVEGSAAAVFLAIAIPAAIGAFAHGHASLPLVLLLVGLYAVVSRSGPAHKPMFTVEARVAGYSPQIGAGASLRSAQAQAAGALLARESGTP